MYESFSRAADQAVCGPQGDFDQETHGFVVKRAALSIQGNNAVISGQISHALNGVGDDQIFYTGHIENGVVVRTETTVESGGLAALPLDIVSAGLNALGVPVPPGAAGLAAGGLDQLLHGNGWKGVSKVLIASIVQRAAQLYRVPRNYHQDQQIGWRDRCERLPFNQRQPEVAGQVPSR